MDRSLPRYVHRKNGWLYFYKRGMKSVKIESQAPPGQEDMAAIRGDVARLLGVPLKFLAPDIEGDVAFWRGLEKSARGRATKTGREFGLPNGWALSAFLTQGGKCAVSGMKMSRDRRKHSPFAPSIDRIDPKGGYTPDNTQLICYIVNCAKNQFTMPELLSMCMSIIDTNPPPKKKRRLRSLPLTCPDTQ